MALSKEEIVNEYNKDIRVLRSAEAKSLAALKAWEKENFSKAKADAAGKKNMLTVKAVAEYEKLQQDYAEKSKAVKACMAKTMRALKKA